MKKECRSIRLKGYDYSKPGAYFLTLCTHDKVCLFGDIVNGEMQLNHFGRIVSEEWQKSEVIRKEIKLDEFVVMPNHLHGIVVIGCCCRGDRPVAPTVVAAVWISMAWFGRTAVHAGRGGVIMEYKSYLKYKDSGVEWLGEIPECWDVTCLKYSANEVAELDDPKLLPYIRITYVNENGSLCDDTCMYGLALVGVECLNAHSHEVRVDEKNSFKKVHLFCILYLSLNHSQICLMCLKYFFRLIQSL